MTKVVLNDIVNLQNETSAVNTINVNSSVIKTAFDNTLSRDGSLPNQMEASLDMNSNRILNLLEPLSGGEPFRLADAQDLILIANPSAVDGNVFTNVSAATLAVIPASVNSITVAGYLTAGDGGNGIYYKVASGAANPGKITSADGAHWQLKQYPVNVKALGAKGDGVAFDESAINNAHTLSLQLKTQVFLPSGTYIVRPTLSAVAPGIPVTRYFSLNLDSNSFYQGVKGQTTIKMADNSSSDAFPKDVNIFVVITPETNITLTGIIFDLNGANNLINPGRAAGSPYANQYCCGALNITGNDVNVDGLYIYGCEFNNCPGTNQIVTGQPANAYAGILSKNVYIYDNNFNNNGLDVDDHSALYCWAEYAWIYGNNFKQSEALSRVNRNWVALEIHGKDTWFYNNYIENFYRACWISSNFTRHVTNVHIYDNDFHVWSFGPSFFRELSIFTDIFDIHIHDNDIYISNLSSPGAIKAGISMNTLFGVSDIKIHDNFILAVGVTYDSAGLTITAGPGSVIRNVFFTNNYVQNCVTGIYARVNTADGVLDEIYDEGNTYLNLGGSDPSKVSVGSRFEAHAPAFIGTVSSVKNRYIDKVGDFDWGIQLIGDIDTFNAEHNIYESLNNYTSNSPYSIDYATLGTNIRRLGKQACTGTSAPTTGSWLYGEEFWNYSPSRTRNISLWKYDGGAGTWSVSAGVGYGTGSERTNIAPALTTRDRNYSYFNTDSSKFDIWNGTTWLESL